VDASSTDIDDLATALFALQARRRTTAEVTAQITGAIVRWAVARGWSPLTEARVRLPNSSPDARRLGYVDVMIRRSGSDPDLAIEIDSTDKPWSVAKLRHAAQAGMRAVWVRWGDETWAGIHEGIDVIQLPVLRGASSAGRSVDQLTLRL
jgi:hypothetical protein